MLKHREEEGPEGWPLGTHSVTGSGEKEGGKRRMGEIWSGPGVVVPWFRRGRAGERPLRSEASTPPTTCSWLSQHLGTSVRLASAFFVSFLQLIRGVRLDLLEVQGGSYPGEWLFTVGSLAGCFGPPGCCQCFEVWGFASSGVELA